jgi:hypothetical protein
MIFIAKTKIKIIIRKIACVVLSTIGFELCGFIISKKIVNNLPFLL